MYPGLGLLQWIKALWVLTRLPYSRLIALPFVNIVRCVMFLSSTTATHLVLAPAVIQPGISVGLPIRMAEGESQGHQSDALASTVSLHNEPIQPPLKSTTLSAGRRGRHSNALDQLGRELDTHDDKLESDSETDDSTTGMYIPAVIHDKARGLRRRTK